MRSGRRPAVAILVRRGRWVTRRWPGGRCRTRCCSRVRCGWGCPRTGCSRGCLAWGVALLAVAVAGSGCGRFSPPRRRGSCWGGGVLSYGLVLGGLLAAGFSSGRTRVGARLRPRMAGRGSGPRTRMRACGCRGPRRVAALERRGVSRRSAGFWWFTGLDGYAKVRVIYAASIAAARPYAYFVWANLGRRGVRDRARGGSRACAASRAGRLPALPALLVAAAGGDAGGGSLRDVEGRGRADLAAVRGVDWRCRARSSPRPRRGSPRRPSLALLVNHLLLTVW